MQTDQLWYHFFKKPFTGEEPRFFDIAKEPWVIEAESQYPEIRKEIESFVQQNLTDLKEYRFNNNKGAPQWQTLPLISWGYVHRKNLHKLPVTWSAFKKMDGVVSVSLSRLTAGSTVGEHRGDTNAIYRCHYGIIIPGTLPECGFTVESETREWREGKLLAFCDARLHSAKNETSKDRYVLIIDRIRDPFLPLRNSVCATIIATHLLYLLDQYLPFYQSAPEALLRLMVWFLSVPIKSYLLLNRRR